MRAFAMINACSVEGFEAGIAEDDIIGPGIRAFSMTPIATCCLASFEDGITTEGPVEDDMAEDLMIIPGIIT